MRLLIAALMAGLPQAPAAPRTFRFDEQPPGTSPAGFTCARTGKGRPGSWMVVADETAPGACAVRALGP
jgi:hypothetical protein